MNISGSTSYAQLLFGQQRAGCPQSWALKSKQAVPAKSGQLSAAETDVQHLNSPELRGFISQRPVE